MESRAFLWILGSSPHLAPEYESKPQWSSSVGRVLSIKRGGFLGASILLFFFFYWSIVDLQCCVNFCCIAKWVTYTNIYIPFHTLFHDGLSQDSEYSSLCVTVGPCCLSILHIVVSVPVAFSLPQVLIILDFEIRSAIKGPSLRETIKKSSVYCKLHYYFRRVRFGMSVSLNVEEAHHWGFVKEQSWWPSHLESSPAQRTPTWMLVMRPKLRLGPRWASVTGWQVSSAHHGITDSCDPQSITLWATLWPSLRVRNTIHLTNRCTRTVWSKKHSRVWIFCATTAFQIGIKRKVSQSGLALLYITARRNYHYK